MIILCNLNKRAFAVAHSFLQPHIWKIVFESPADHRSCLHPIECVLLKVGSILFTACAIASIFGFCCVHFCREKLC